MAEQLYCLCKKPYDASQAMIECSKCFDWFHAQCIGETEIFFSHVDEYICPGCVPAHGQSKLKIAEKTRRRKIHDYHEMNEGLGIVVKVDFQKLLQNKKYPPLECLQLGGELLCEEYFHENGFQIPILVESSTGIGIEVPEGMCIDDIMELVGEDTVFPVIDVSTQLEDPYEWNMRSWRDAFLSHKRNHIFNVISLEFSKTKLADVIVSPRVVRQIDWIDNVWKDPTTKPLVQKYCLMSFSGAYTDFHIDFGGTSVWYHILQGSKKFYFVPPTKHNLEKFTQWSSSPNQSDVFFADICDSCYEIFLEKGHTLFIP
eukprot:Sdes_comp14134_c0_seq1m3391